MSDGLIRALRRGMIILMAVVLLRSLVFLRANSDAYQPLSLEWAAFGLLAAIAVAIAVLIRNDGAEPGEPGRGRGWPALLTALTLLASAMATAAVPADRLLTSAHWSWYIVGWFLVSINLGRRLDVLVSILALHLGLVIGQVLLAGPLDRHDVAQLLIRTAVFGGAQLAFATAGRVAVRATRSASRIREHEARAITRQRIADEVIQDQRDRHTTIAATTLPLLQGLSDGTLSPADPVVRKRCMVEATRLRRLMAESDQHQNPLSHELRACVDVAERAGVQVDVAFRGTGPSPELASRRRLTEPVIAVLAEAREYARVTVVGTSRDVVVSVVAAVRTPREFDLQEALVPAGSAGPDGQGGPDGVEVTVVSSPGQIWVTARWEAA